MRARPTGTARRVAATAAAVTAGSLLSLAPVPAQAAGGVCDGVAGCRVVARVDVNGDGVRDTVGVARRGTAGAPEGRVVVRVKVSPRRIVQTTRPTSYWYAGPFHGAAGLDGQRGKELVLGFTTGAHTSFHWALTWRDGGLVTLRAPGGDRHWVVDSAANVSLGWFRAKGTPPGRVTFRSAERVGTTKRFDARLRSYRWTKRGWSLVSTENRRVSEATAWSWGGWHVPGLPRW